MDVGLEAWLTELRRRGHDVEAPLATQDGQVSVVVDGRAVGYSGLRELLRVPDAHFVGEGGALPDHVSTDDLLAQLELMAPRHYRLKAEPGEYRISGTDASLTVSAAASATFSAELVRNGQVVPPQVPAGLIAPDLLLTAVISKAVGKVSDGDVIVAVAPAWRQLLTELARDPAAIYRLGPRRLEELVAASYERAGYHVILTPRSGDDGVDVIATRLDGISIRIIDQVKALAPGRRVTADDVRALVGALETMPDVSKGIITTTGEFAPRIADNPRLKPLMPTRLELRDRQGLFDWFDSVMRDQSRSR